MDFTKFTFNSFLKYLKSKYNDFLSISDYLENSNQQIIQPINILRHEVEFLPADVLQMAKSESEIGINRTYYFRIVSASYDLKIMNRILSNLISSQKDKNVDKKCLQIKLMCPPLWYGLLRIIRKVLK